MAGVEVEGLRELNRDIRRAADQGMRKRVGEANKEIGKLVISKLHPRPMPASVGEGAGAAVRPSATFREVVLKVGGAHRVAAPMQQWGKRQVVAPNPPRRPFILGTAEQHRREIEAAYLDGLLRAMKPAFHDTKAS